MAYSDKKAQTTEKKRIAKNYDAALRDSYKKQLDSKFHVYLKREQQPFPATPTQVADYLEQMRVWKKNKRNEWEKTETLPSVTTLVMTTKALSRAHIINGYDDPTDSQLVKSTVKKLRKKYKRAPTQASTFTIKDYFKIIDAIRSSSGKNLMRAIRDEAVFSLLFFSGSRINEILSLQSTDLEIKNTGAHINIRQTKTSDTGIRKFVSRRKDQYCPIAAIEAWLSRSQIKKGFVFRKVHDTGVVNAVNKSLAYTYALTAFKQYAKKAGLKLEKSGTHAFRASVITELLISGATIQDVGKHVGQANPSTTMRYYRKDKKTMEEKTPTKLLEPKEDHEANTGIFGSLLKNIFTKKND